MSEIFKFIKGLFIHCDFSFKAGNLTPEEIKRIELKEFFKAISDSDFEKVHDLYLRDENLQAICYEVEAFPQNKNEIVGEKCYLDQFEGEDLAKLYAYFEPNFPPRDEAAKN